MAHRIPEPAGSHAANTLPPEVQRIVGHYTSVADSAHQKRGSGLKPDVDWAGLAQAAVAFAEKEDALTTQRLLGIKDAVERGFPSTLDAKMVNRFATEVIEAVHKAKGAAAARS